MLQDALDNIVRRMNKSSARDLGSYAIVGGVATAISLVVKGIRKEIKLKHQQSIHAYQDQKTGKSVINSQGIGHKIAEIHQGDDDNYYKWFDNSWHYWDGTNWNIIPRTA